MRSGFITFLKFGGLSGGGWILDFIILLSLVSALSAPPFVANVISSSIAALTVFLVSRRFLFASAEGALGTRVAIYFVYTLSVIAVAALAMALIVTGLDGMTQIYGYSPGRTALAAAAKILVTPPQLLMNFLMSRHMSEREFARKTQHCPTRS